MEEAAASLATAKESSVDVALGAVLSEQESSIQLQTQRCVTGVREVPIYFFKTRQYVANSNRNHHITINNVFFFTFIS